MSEQLQPTAGRPLPDLSVDVVTIFPEYLAPLRSSLLGKAIERGQVRVDVHDLRGWTERPAPDASTTPRTAAVPAW